MLVLLCAVTILLGHCIISAGALLLNPLHFLRYHIVLAAVYASGVLELFSEITVPIGSNDIRVSGLLWLTSLCMMGSYLLLTVKRGARYNSWLARRYFLFLMWIIVVQAFALSLDFSGVLHLLELLYPLFIFLICYAHARSQGDTDLLLGAFNWYAVLLCGLIPINFYLLGYNEVSIVDYARVMSTSLLPALFLFFATAVHRSSVWIIPAGMLLAIPILTISRGVTAAVLVAVAYYSAQILLVRRWHKQFVFATLLVTVVGFGVITSDSFQERSIAGSINDPSGEEIINTSGRFRVWMQFYEKITSSSALHLLIGEGLGASDDFAVESDPTGWFQQPHSEYIRFFFNTGLIGTVLYFGMFAGLARRIRKGSRNAANMRIWGAALLAIYALFVLSLYENFLLYNPFGFTQNAFVLFAVALRTLSLDGSAVTYPKRVIRS